MKNKELSKQDKLREAEKDLKVFIEYLKAHNLSDTDIQDRLGELEVYYDQATNQAVIARADHKPFELILCYLDLTGELSLPKQLLVNKLDCGYNQLQTLPELPAGLIELWCSDNQLQTLPKLPDSLTMLWRDNNPLTKPARQAIEARGF
jgi:Leucine-rich repeat (LRR) protein